MQNNDEEFLVAKTIPSIYFLQFAATEEQSRISINFAHVSEIIEHPSGLVCVKLFNGINYTFSGEHAQQILDELHVIRRRYQA